MSMSLLLLPTPFWGRQASAGVLRQPFDPALPPGNAPDASETTLSRRDSSLVRGLGDQDAAP